jgi:hypothetical protein
MKFIFIFGLIFFFGGLILFKANFHKIEIEEKGSVVEMTLIDLPSLCMTGSYYFVTFEYNGQTLEKRIKGMFCEQHMVGDKVKMKYLEGYSDILFERESGKIDAYAFLIISLFGLFIVVAFCKKAFL